MFYDSLTSAPGIHFDFERWHDATCRSLSLTECGNRVSPSFQGRVQVRDFGTLSISDVASLSADYPLAIERRSLEVRRDACDDLMLYLVREGEIGISQDGRSTRARVGDFFLYDQSRPFTMTLGDCAHGLVLKLPREQMQSRLPLSRQLTARRIDAATPLGVLARSIIGQLPRVGGETQSETAARLAPSVLDIMATILETQLLGPPENPDHRRLKRIKEFMLGAIDDATMTVDGVVLQSGLAARTVYRLFAAEGTTPMRWLWQQRLTASYDALTGGRMHKVTDVALNFGFADVSHFSRSFKKRFGCSPHTLLQR